MEKPHPGAHVGMHCENHPDCRYSCKVIAVNPDGRYNGSRNIFYIGTIRNGERIMPEPPECDCPGSALIINRDSVRILNAFHAKEK